MGLPQEAILFSKTRELITQTNKDIFKLITNGLKEKGSPVNGMTARTFNNCKYFRPGDEQERDIMVACEGSDLDNITKVFISVGKIGTLFVEKTKTGRFQASNDPYGATVFSILSEREELHGNGNPIYALGRIQEYYFALKAAQEKEQN